MKRYETRREFLEEIGTMAKNVASDYLRWTPAYDQKDLDEVWQYVRSGKRIKNYHGREKIGSTVKPPITRTTLFVKSIKNLEEFAKRTRTRLGLKAPVSLSELEEAIKRIDKSMSKSKVLVPTPVTIQYPIKHIKADEGLNIWHISAYNFNLDILEMFSESGLGFQSLQLAISGVQLLTNSHPALCLAYLLSDIPIYQHNIDIIIDPFFHINMYIREPAVPMWLVSDMYQMAREVLFWGIKKRHDFHPKPRVMSKKVSVLVEFVADNKDLSWEKRWMKWNNTYPDWGYNSDNSMRVVYYRARLNPIEKILNLEYLKGGRTNERRS